MEALARRLWAGPLADPEAPGRALARALPRLGYDAALARARALARFALPVDLAALRARFPWSIDLARLSVETTGEIAPLRAAVTAQGRRFATLAQALWSLGRPDEALAVFRDAETLDAEDRAVEAELRLLAGLPLAPVPGPRGAHLSLLATWRHEGAAALARRVALEGPSLPLHPPLWSWLVETFVQERDFARARDALARFERRAPGHPEAHALTIRLALESEDTARARRLLDAQGALAEPWRWPARRHVQHLRCLADEIAAREVSDPAALRQAAEAALRLFPRNAVLQGLHLTAREMTGDWDLLARDLDAHSDPRAAAHALIRIGLPEAALARLDNAPEGPPDEAVRTRLRRAEALLRLGRLDAARAALGPPPAAVPLAADHAYWAAEIAAAARDLPAAGAALAPALAHSPTRMGLILTAARVAFLGGDDAGAEAHLARFRTLKAAQTGAPPADDLRDLIVRDAARGQPGPGLAARAFARAVPAFRPVPGPPIPPRIAHYWEGPRSAPLERSLRAWAGLFAQTTYDATSARDWLARHTDLAPLFDRLAQPATRADLFRVALLAAEGGLFADLDEYPRAPVADWLDGAAAVLVVEEGHATIANNFLAARPGLALFTRLRDRIATTLARTPQPYPWWHSGPAPLTLEAHRDRDTPGLRFLAQPDYDARIATNLPFPHKRGPGHWR